MKGFWKTIKKPVFVLAPMADVTDFVFRQMMVKRGKPDILWTEFVSAEGLLSSGKEKLLRDLWFSENERPILAQIFGSDPSHMKEVAQMMAELGFDGVDINMGCPDSGVESGGGGAAMIRNPKLAQEVIRAVKEGAGDLPVSVKTRLGYERDILEDWLPRILETEPAAITIHLRTRKEMSKVPAKWERARDAVLIRDKYFSSGDKPLVLGNGDVVSLEDAKEKVNQFGVDGVMIGRGVFSDPWIFTGKKPDIEERLRVLVEHTKLYEETYKSNISLKNGGLKNFDIMKKHYKAYANGFDGAKELRIRLMEAGDAQEVEEVVKEFLYRKSSKGVFGWIKRWF